MNSRQQKLLAILALAAACASTAQADERPGQRYVLDIAAPSDEAMVFSNSGDLSVRVAVAPQLAQGDSVEVLLDGVPAASPSASLEVPLTGVARGRHVLQARIIDSTGNVGSVSASSMVYVWQASTLFPTRHAK